MDVETRPITAALGCVNALALRVWTMQRITILTLTDGHRHNAAIRLAEHVTCVATCPPAFKRLQLDERGLVCEAVILRLKARPVGCTPQEVADSMRSLGWPYALSTICRHEAESCPAQLMPEFLVTWTGPETN